MGPSGRFTHVIVILMCGPAFFGVRPHSMGETRFFVVLLENHFKKK